MTEINTTLLNRVAERIARQATFAIRDAVILEPDVARAHPYAGQFILEAVIADLQKRV